MTDTTAIFPDINPSQTSVMRAQADVIETRFGRGRRQRLARAGNSITVEWQLAFLHRPLADIARIDSFLAAQAGVAPFFWTPPPTGQPVRPALFVCESWQITPSTHQLASLSAVFMRHAGQTNGAAS